MIVVSNRLPFSVEEENGGIALRASGGGLVTALLPVLRESGGCWIGWTGSASDESIAGAFKQCAGPNYSFEPLSLSAAEKTCFYQGCCNQIIWPLFHGLPSRCDFDPAYWGSYCTVNEKFADAVERAWRNDDFVWVHDYHLMILAGCLRARGARYRMGYFHHIPFPHPDILEKLPWRNELLRSMLQFNTIGFQTVRDRRNFVACVRQFLCNVRVRAVAGKLLVRSENQCAMVGTYPISIDYEEFAGASADPATAAAAGQIRSDLNGSRIILGIDRLDYTKGILERLKSFETLIATNPGSQGGVSMIQIVVPSREEIGEYQQLRLAIERRVSQINGKYATPGWVPVHYLYRHLSRSELIAFYRAADIALVTPLKDGMNLVAKEFCACRVDETGVLILSEFAGAAAELNCGALIVNSYDTDGVAEALLCALRMDDREQRARMHAMRDIIRSHDVFRWSRSFCAQATPPKLVARPAAVHFAGAPEPRTRSNAAAAVG
ncbi:MAG: trehalose-6-phosphate synthase [Acidobacteriia bacterium]|nr:trehalose-6-phosphate synthase [Terriglobia bacterium]